MERIKYPLFFLRKICYWNNRITDKIREHNGKCYGKDSVLLDKIGARLRKKLTITEKQGTQMRFKADKIAYAQSDKARKKPRLKTHYSALYG